MTVWSRLCVMSSPSPSTPPSQFKASSNIQSTSTIALLSMPRSALIICCSGLSSTIRRECMSNPGLLEMPVLKLAASSTPPSSVSLKLLAAPTSPHRPSKACGFHRHRLCRRRPRHCCPSYSVRRRRPYRKDNSSQTDSGETRIEANGHYDGAIHRTHRCSTDDDLDRFVLHRCANRVYRYHPDTRANLFSHNMFFTGFFGSPICELIFPDR
mmetsp:Transcript_86750/g.245569  ORF Transcript_86750/g.245569 Transcript_86750/m.245569 type:complete len:212 (+) Transcript_86750:97-732(+)